MAKAQKGNPDIVAAGEATQFQKDNSVSLRHGGEAGVVALREDKPFRSPAREAELAVAADLEMKGRAFLVRRNAIRTQAVANLYWGAISKLAADLITEHGIPPGVVIAKLDGHVRRYGWLAGLSMRAWQQVKDEEKGGSSVTDYEILLERGEND